MNDEKRAIRIYSKYTVLCGTQIRTTGNEEKGNIQRKVKCGSQIRIKQSEQ